VAWSSGECLCNATVCVHPSVCPFDRQPVRCSDAQLVCCSFGARAQPRAVSRREPRYEAQHGLLSATCTCILLCANRFRALLGLDQVKACFSIRLSVTGLADFAFLLVVTRPLVGIRVTEVVCLSVVVSACKHISGTTSPIST